MTQHKISRRGFLLGAGAGLAALGGGLFWGARSPQISFAEPNFAGGKDHLLVAYSSRYGSTGDVAAAIGKTLQQHRFRVDVRRLSRVEGIAGYRGVVLGSPVHSGKWLPEATDFIQQHQDELAKRPVAYFLTSMTLALTQEVQAVAKIGGALTAVRQQFTRIEPVETALFAGALDYRKMSPLMQVMYRIFAADDRSGDYRDWKAIAAWAGQVAVRFS